MNRVPDRSEFKKAFLNILEGRVEEPTPDGYLTGVELGDYLYRTVPEVFSRTASTTRKDSRSAIEHWRFCVYAFSKH